MDTTLRKRKRKILFKTLRKLATMAATEKNKQANKRKEPSNSLQKSEERMPKKQKVIQKRKLNSSSKPFKNPSKTSKILHEKKTNGTGEKNQSKSKKEHRMAAKELAESRKIKRKPHYTLQQELALVWEKMRCRNITKEHRTKYVTEALSKMKGKIAEIAGSHVSSRVLQTCVKYCTKEERDIVFEELRPHLLTLSCNTYAVHLVKRLLDSASKNQIEEFISSLRGHVSSLLRHMVGSVVVEHAFQLGKGPQKRALLYELFSPEFQLFKDLSLRTEGRLADMISKLGLNKSSVLQHTSSVIHPVLEKGIVDHSIIHTALVEYLSIADKISAADVIQHLASPLLVRMMHTKDGSSVAMFCIKNGSSKERKKIIKGMKGHITKIAQDQYGSLVLVCILSVVDDTKLLTKVVIRECQPVLKELALDKCGRRPLLHLLHPNHPRYFHPVCVASLALPVQEGTSEDAVVANQNVTPNASTNTNCDAGDDGALQIIKETQSLVERSKKDPALRRSELLVESGLAESLVNSCIENAGELLRSNFGKEILYEVANGGADGILRKALPDKLDSLHKVIATIASLPKVEDEEHLFDNFHSSRAIRKLILDCPSFAATLWKSALEGKCEMWAQGHSSKVVSAFLESSNQEVQALARSELQPLIDSGQLNLLVTNNSVKQC